MKQDLIKHLEYLKNLEPDNGFVLSSRRLITAVEPAGRISFFSFFKPAFIGAAAVFVLVIMGAYFIGVRSEGQTTYGSLSQNKLKKELQDMTIAIQVDEITYRQSVESEVASALQEISNDRVRYLNSGVIKQEAGNLDVDSGSKTKIDSLLETVIF